MRDSIRHIYTHIHAFIHTLTVQTDFKYSAIQSYVCVYMYIQFMISDRKVNPHNFNKTKERKRDTNTRTQVHILFEKQK